MKKNILTKAKKYVQSSLALCLLSSSIFAVNAFREEPEEALAVVYQREVPLISKIHAQELFSNTCKIANKKQASLVVETLINASEKHDIDFQLLLAVMAAESNCKHNAVSPRGALGLMQLMPTTAKWLGANKPMNIEQNINAAAKYLSYLIKEFDGNFNLAIAAYNAGPNAVKRYKAIPPYRETKGYVKKVLLRYNKYIELTKI